MLLLKFVMVSTLRMNILNMFSSFDVTYLRHMFPNKKVMLVPLTPSSSSWLDNDSSVAESGKLVVSPPTSSSVDEVPDADPSGAVRSTHEPYDAHIIVLGFLV